MENVMANGFTELTPDDLQKTDGGGFVAFVYALGFIAGCSPLAVCVGAGLVVAGTACCIYGIATHR